MTAALRASSGSSAENLFISLFEDYFIVDEAHHASAETYQKVLAYFTPRFTLGLTATPERADGNNMRHTRTLGIVEIDPTIWKKLSEEEKEEIRQVSEEKLEEYYRKLEEKA